MIKMKKRRRILKENKQYNTFVKMPRVIIIVIDTTAKNVYASGVENGKWKNIL